MAPALGKRHRGHSEKFPGFQISLFRTVFGNVERDHHCHLDLVKTLRFRFHFAACELTYTKANFIAIILMRSTFNPEGYPMRAVAYFRKSNDDRGKLGDSVEQQREWSATFPGVSIVREFSDQSISG